MEFHQLSIKERIQETADTVTFVFEIPSDLTDQYAYKAGQYLTLKVPHSTGELRRSYSMSSSPLEGKVAISVKKVTGGRASTWLTEQVKVGDILHVGSPEGRFIAKTNPDKHRTWYLMASGSGITPVFSILKTVLEEEPMSTVFLLYGSRNEENIIFRQALSDLHDRYANQLIVEHCLSQPQRESKGGIFGFFGKKVTNWQGRTGRITPTMAEEFLEENPARGKEDEALYYICGPGNMAEGIRMALETNNIPSKRIYTELFVNSGNAPGEGMEEGGSTTGKKLRANIRGEIANVLVPEGKTIIDGLVAAKFEPPYSCTAGACSTCMAKVIKGQVHMEVCHALEPEEIAQGYILACQAKLVSDEVEIDFEA